MPAGDYKIFRILVDHILRSKANGIRITHVDHDFFAISRRLKIFLMH